MKKFILLVAVFAMLTCSTAFGAVVTKSDHYSAYNSFDMTVASLSFYANGDTMVGKIYDTWYTQSTFPLNNFENISTNIIKYPGYEKARCSFDHKVGLPTPWGTIGYTFTRANLEVIF